MSYNYVDTTYIKAQPLITYQDRGLVPLHETIQRQLDIYSKDGWLLLQQTLDMEEKRCSLLFHRYTNEYEKYNDEISDYAKI